MRRNSPPIHFASAFESIVLPTPGTSSISRWPLQSNTRTAFSTVSFFPRITFSTWSTIFLAPAEISEGVKRTPQKYQRRNGKALTSVPRATHYEAQETARVTLQGKLAPALGAP